MTICNNPEKESLVLISFRLVTNKRCNICIGQTQKQITDSTECSTSLTCFPLLTLPARVSDGAVSHPSIDQALSAVPIGMLMGDGEEKKTAQEDFSLPDKD